MVQTLPQPPSSRRFGRSVGLFGLQGSIFLAIFLWGVGLRFSVEKKDMVEKRKKTRVVWGLSRCLTSLFELLFSGARWFCNVTMEGPKQNFSHVAHSSNQIISLVPMAVREHLMFSVELPEKPDPKNIWSWPQACA